MQAKDQNVGNSCHMVSKTADALAPSNIFWILKNIRLDPNMWTKLQDTISGVQFFGTYLVIFVENPLYLFISC